MGKNVKGKIRGDLIEALELQAKKGKYAGKFSIYPAEVEKLTEEKNGFKVELGKGFSERAKKNSQKVIISWNDAQPGTKAFHMAKLTQRYCHTCNATERKHLKKAGQYQKYGFFSPEEVVHKNLIDSFEFRDEETGEIELLAWDW